MKWGFMVKRISWSLLVLFICIMATSGAGLGNVVINEVELGPSADSADWVELYNTGDEDLDIGRWSVWIVNNLPSTGHWYGVIKIPQDTVIEATGFYVAEGESSWNVNNGTVILKTESGTIVDETHQLVDHLSDDFTWSRYPDGRDTGHKSDWVFIMSSKNAYNLLNSTGRS